MLASGTGISAALRLDRGGTAACGTRHGHRTVPTGELAGGILVAPEEDTSFLGPFLGNGSRASFLRTPNTEGERLDILAGRIVRAGEEFTVLPGFHFHGMPALLAHLRGGLDRRVLIDRYSPGIM